MIDSLTLFLSLCFLFAFLLLLTLTTTYTTKRLGPDKIASSCQMDEAISFLVVLLYQIDKYTPRLLLLLILLKLGVRVGVMSGGYCGGCYASLSDLIAHINQPSQKEKGCQSTIFQR